MATVSDSESDFEVTDVQAVSRRIDRMKKRLRSLEAGFLAGTINEIAAAMLPQIKVTIQNTVVAEGLKGFADLKLKREAFDKLESLPMGQREPAFLAVRKKFYDQRYPYVCSDLVLVFFLLLVLVFGILFLFWYMSNTRTKDLLC